MVVVITNYGTLKGTAAQDVTNGSEDGELDISNTDCWYIKRKI